MIISALTYFGGQKSITVLLLYKMVKKVGCDRNRSRS